MLGMRLTRSGKAVVGDIRGRVAAGTASGRRGRSVRGGREGKIGEWMSSGLQRQAQCAENSDVGRPSRRSLLILALVGALLAAASAIWKSGADVVRLGTGLRLYRWCLLASQLLTPCGGPTMGTAAVGQARETWLSGVSLNRGNKLTASGRGESTHGLDGRSGSRSKSRDSLMLGASWPHTTLIPSLPDPLARRAKPRRDG